MTYVDHLVVAILVTKTIIQWMVKSIFFIFTLYLLDPVCALFVYDENRQQRKMTVQFWACMSITLNSHYHDKMWNEHEDSLWCYFTHDPSLSELMRWPQRKPDKRPHGQKLPCHFLQGGQKIPHYFARVDKTSHTDLMGWTKDPILIFYPGQNIPFLST